MMMMMELAKATAHVDVYIVGSNNTGIGGPPRAAGAPADAAAAAAARSRRSRRRSATSATRTSAGYPAINLPNGFADTGSPTNAVIYAQPFRELEIIALAKAYQDAAGFHLRKPARLDQGKQYPGSVVVRRDVLRKFSGRSTNDRLDRRGRA